MADEQGGTTARAGTDRLPEEIAAGFSSRFPDFRCVVCGEENFEILSGDEDEFLSPYDICKEIHHQRSAAITTVGIACTNCGHIYRFPLEILRRRWLGE